MEVGLLLFLLCIFFFKSMNYTENSQERGPVRSTLRLAQIHTRLNPGLIFFSLAWKCSRCQCCYMCAVKTGFLYLVKHFWILQDVDITIIIMVMVISKVGDKSIP